MFRGTLASAFHIAHLQSLLQTGLSTSEMENKIHFNIKSQDFALRLCLNYFLFAELGTSGPLRALAQVLPGIRQALL